MQPDETIRKRVLFSGRVQGVGFRYTTSGLARRFNVTGYVKNLSDGRVELVAEGALVEVDRFIQAVVQEMRPNIAEMVTTDLPATGAYRRFDISF